MSTKPKVVEFLESKGYQFNGDWTLKTQLSTEDTRQLLSRLQDFATKKETADVPAQ